MKLDPKQKRIAAAIAAGGVLALVVLLSRRSGGDEVGAPTGALSSVADPGASSFADNGAAMGQLSSSISDLTGRFDTGVSQIIQSQPTAQDIADSVGAGVAAGIGSINWAQSSDPAAPGEAPAQLAATGQPAGKPKGVTVAKAPVKPTAKQKTAARKPNVSFQDSGSRAGRNFKTVTKDRKVYRYYESKPGKGDFGVGGKVYVRPQK